MRKVFNIICLALFPVANFYLFEWYTHNPWETMNIPIQFLNIFLFELLMIIFLLIFGKLKWSLRFQSIFFMIIGLANYYVLEFRSEPIMPWDIYSVKTAASVAGNFNYTPGKQAIIVILCYIILIIAESFVTLEIKGSVNWKIRVIVIRGVCATACLCLLWGFTSMLHKDSTISNFKMYDKLFTPSVMSKRDGTAIAFMMELKYISIDKPDGYSATTAGEILGRYDDDAVDTDSTKDLPNIIVIMNEAFSDPMAITFPVKTRQTDTKCHILYGLTLT